MYSGMLVFKVWLTLPKLSKNNPKGAIVACAAMFVSGALVAMLGYDDEERDYYNLPEYVRRSNLCFKVGNSWVTIPLPIEYRAIYGLGELCASVINGGDKYTPKETAEKVAQQFSQLLPLDMLEGGGGWNPLIPTFAKPWAKRMYSIQIGQDCQSTKRIHSTN